MGGEIGYAWLASTYELDVVQPFPVESRIGRARHTLEHDGRRSEAYLESMRPPATLPGHLTFALKHEGVHLEFLARLFRCLPPESLAAWVRSEPTGQYARRAGFLYEWLTGEFLDITKTGGNYRDALNPDDYVTATQPRRNRRWRINDNLPGTPDYCPMVRRTPQVDRSRGYDIRYQLESMEGEFGADILRRSAVWLTIKESQASFVIEHEGSHQGRIQRFAAAMEAYCGQKEEPLSAQTLSELQSAILGVATIQPGLRQSPVFVGSRSVGQGPVVHYVCPPWEWLSGLLGGLSQFLDSTGPEDAITRAAVASFGFVFIHPLADGNGRISRFLINDTLRRDGAVPEPFILPISAAITSSSMRRIEYDRVLERYSRPLMRRYGDAVDFLTRRQAYPDGIESDFTFSAYEEAGPTWRYPDLTDQVEYLEDIVRYTLEHEMHQQAAIQRAWHMTRETIKEWVEGPDEHIDRIIRAVRQHGSVSGKLRRDFPVLDDPLLTERLEAIVGEGFAGIGRIE
ncbi:cell filamentation protein Fic [Halomonas sp. 1513]|nr:Fic family protein [Halomonas sp. 1513]APX93072.1 cell filamentation protein Fic [Halomonas sp. 1513]